MSTVVYLANQQVQIVVGSADKKSISVKQYYTFDAPEGSIINGMVMDVVLFTSFLSDIWQEKKLQKKDVTLVINSTKFVGRSIEMPVLNDAKTFQYISREYADMGREDEMSFSFIHIANAEGKRKKVYAEGIEPDFIKDYIDIFGEVGIKLNAIYSGESSLITFTRLTAAKENQTFVLMVADAMSLTTLLWVDGSFYYYNMARCFHDPGTLEYANDIARSLSQLTQFMKANQIESTLESILIAGIRHEDKELYRNAVRDVGIETPVHAFNFKTGGGAIVDPNLQNYLHAVSGLYDGGKTENFLVDYAQLEKKKTKDNSTDYTKYYITIGSVFALAVIVLLVTFIVSISKKKELNALKEYNENPVTQMQLMDYEKYSYRNSYLSSQYAAISDIEENISTYPTGCDSVLAIFDKCSIGYAAIEYQSFDAESGIITISAKASNVDDINKFIKKLTEQNVFSYVDYTGYHFDVNSGLWDVNVICTLSEAAGR